MNVTIDANATFNPLGEIKPLYVRLEDENHELHTYKIENIEQVKEEKYAGIGSFLYVCQISVGGVLRQIKIRYYIASHKWALID
ncbi:MAG: hypothetical protein II247_04185 [Lachnospiraceae bacterium]|nr:hypothetical protein [Lachnospiraceae bacterium]